jgi:hypothetical protein
LASATSVLLHEVNLNESYLVDSGPRRILCIFIADSVLAFATISPNTSVFAAGSALQ